MTDEPAGPGAKSARGIAVWTVTLQTISEESWPHLAALLDAKESERAEAFVFERHRRQFGAAHALKRLMLSAATQGRHAPQDWSFQDGAFGKPHVAEPQSPHFNLSHCDGLVACAVSHCVDLGVDVEPVADPAPLDLADHYFACPESRLLTRMEPAERPLGFFRLWTLKEAYVKARGLGLTQPLDAFAFTLKPISVHFFDPALGDPSTWQFHQTVLGERPHVLALAWQGPRLPVHITAVTFEALLAGSGPTP
ncbi:MAG: 4'-phosphopantetheinyl transferase superfamily protein [Pseudomonadota bacterium]